MLKEQYPKAIADLLGIPPQAGVGGPWMSSEGTVLKDWLVAVGEALDIPYAGEKTRMMRALVEAVDGKWNQYSMTSTLTSSGGGGNIATRAFQELFDGLKTHSTAKRRAATNHERGPFQPAGPPGEAEDLRVLRAIRQRAVQPRFRANLLTAYWGRCALTGCDAPAALEAAHVVPYERGGTYHVTNGLLLRADIHNLFDLRLLAFDINRRAVLHPELSRSTYTSLAGQQLADPSALRDRVPGSALGQHRLEAGL